VLDDVERRRFLVEPAGENAAELPVGAAHVELDEGPGQLLGLPGRRRLAIAQPHDHVADTDGLAGPEREVALDAVALVEQAEHCDPFRHGRGAGRELLDGLRHVDRLVFDRGVVLAAALSAPGRAGGEREHQRETRADHPAKHHVQSGVQA
jgi:hypothetical protein